MSSLIPIGNQKRNNALGPSSARHEGTQPVPSWLSLFDKITSELLPDPSQVEPIRDAIELSQTVVFKARESCVDIADAPKNSSLVAFGSLARYELTPASDLDYLLTCSGAPPPDRYLARAVSNIRKAAPNEVTLSDPGTSGLFGSSVQFEEIVSNIGLQGDTNHNLTRRILLLEESIALTNPEQHSQGLEKIISRYLEAKSKNSSTYVPRVLLNDIVRYWRTLTIDYHAKTAPTARYSMRYLKLLFSRKLCFISSIAPLCWLQTDGTRATPEYLVSSYMQPSIIRLCILLSEVSARGGARELTSSQEILTSYSTFLSKSGDTGWREMIRQEISDHEDPKRSPEFGAMRELGKSIHNNLTRLLSSPPLIDFTREYMLI